MVSDNGCKFVTAGAGTAFTQPGMTSITNGTNGNLIGTQSSPLDPRLGPLQNNGGKTFTHALMEDSPAINAGNTTLAVDAQGNPLLTDQRGAGFLRTYGMTTDIGAFEWNPTYGREARSGEPAMPVILRIDRPSSSLLNQSLTMYFELSGTATYSTDYTLASPASYNPYNKYGSVTIPANQSYVDLRFNINDNDDDIVEPMESIVVTLLEQLPNGSTTGYTLDSQRVLTGYIIDNDQWRVCVTTLQSGKMAQPVKFQITRSDETNPAKAMTVYYTLSGSAIYNTDYTLSSPGNYNPYDNYGSVTIPAGQTSIDLTFNVLNDSLAKGTETVVLTVLSDSIYTSDRLPRYIVGSNSTATAGIEDSNICWDITVTPLTPYATKVSAGQTSQPAQYQFTRSGGSDFTQPLKVYYELTGTATAGTDYTSPSNFEYGKYYVTIPAGQSSVDLVV